MTKKYADGGGLPDAPWMGSTALPDAPWAAAPPPAPTSTDWEDVAKSGGTGLLKGGMGIAGMGGDLRELTANLASKASSHLGYEVSPDTVSSVLKFLPLPGMQGPGSGEIRKGVESMTAPLYEPKTGAGRLAETVGEFAPSVVGGPESMALKLGTRVAIPALTAHGASEAATALGAPELAPYAKAVGALTGALGASGLMSAIRGTVSPQANVSADLARALERDNDTIPAVMQRLREARAERPDATLADVGGENVRGLVERIAQTPGAGRTTVIPNLTARQQQQMARITDDVAGLTGTNRTARQAIDQTMAARKREADPLYDIAMDFNARKIPEITDAWARETNQGWGKSILGSPEFKNNLQTEYGIADPTNAPLMKVIDAWKKAADDLVGEAVRSGNNNRARVIGGMRDRLIETVDKHNVAYPEARNAWAGRSKYLEAVEDGRNILAPKVTAEELTSKLAGMSAADLEAYRIGAVAAIRSKMGNDPAKLGDMTKYLRSPEMREKIAAIMPTPQAAESWRKRLNYEVGSSEMTGKALGNSATARRLAERQDADGIVGDLVMDALSHGATGGLLRRTVMALPTRVRDTLRSKSDNILAEVLTTPGADIRGAMRGAAQVGRSSAPPLAPASAYTTPLRVTVRPSDAVEQRQARGGRISNAATKRALRHHEAS